MQKSKSGGIFSLLQKFPNEESCRKHLENILWNGTPICPFCQCEKIYKFKDNKTYKCSECKHNFTVVKGTIFERSHIPLNKWFYAIYIFSSHKKGISSYQLARDIEITQPNAWYMLHKIRHAMNNNNPFHRLLEGIVEIDETYVGGKNKNRHYNKRIKGSQGRSTIDKAPVMGMIERGGIVRTIPIKQLHKKGMQLIVRNKIKAGSTIMTDEYNAYTGLNRYFNHKVVNHSAHQYCDGPNSTNSIEGFWSWLKRSIMGIYHKVSKKYLFRYCDEIEYRYNSRNHSDDDRFDMLLKQFLGYAVKRSNI